MFAPLPAKFSFPEAEERVLAFWEKHDIFGQSLRQRRGAPRFVFYEGPPTANGLPHPGHCLTRAMKDLFPRYQTMCGKLVERKAGWDTHGLPVEVEVCKELGIHTKEEIESYGVEKFVRKCIESVFRYTREWEQMTRRLGFWVNLEEAYVTFHQSYIESVWWGLKTLFERGLLYQGHKVVWWWAQGGTALSAGEVGEGYRTVQDPSVYIRFPLVSEPEASARETEPEASARETEPEASAREQGKEARKHEDPKQEPRASARAALRNGNSAASERPRGLKSAAPHANLDPSKRVSLLVWTTTPWTLISNHFAAVGPDIDYSLVHDKTTDEYFYIATALVDLTAEKLKHKFETVSTCSGTDLVGLRYLPPFDCYYKMMGAQTAQLKEGGEDYIGWRVTLADFVTLDSGTGLVHEAPAYGEVDFDLLQDERRRLADFDTIPLFNAVKPDGTFSDEAPEQYRGRWVKDCDKDIIADLKERSILMHQETIEHEYPFCPRAEDDPLIQYARKSWFVRTSQFKDEFLDNNAGIYWLPDHIRAGRFGDFLRNNVDWALSRERYWGTPLPIWVCEKTGKMEAIGSYAELLAKPGVQGTEVWEQAKAADPELPEHLKVHKPYIDAVTYDSQFAEGARMRRVTEVIDCWWDAGSMPFAQWGFPHLEGSVETFAERFPADFISEALDQTRGWFYGLLAISTLLFRSDKEPRASARADSGMEESSPDAEPRGLKSAAPLGFVNLQRDYPHPYKSCIVLGLMMGEDGLKMSKRKKNYREPSYVFDHYGADAMRWFFFSGQTPWTSVRFQEASIRDAQREFLVRLYNVFSFFTIYANIDGFEVGGDQGEGPRASARAAATGYRPVPERNELDRWIISELHRTIRIVRENLDRFENYPAAGRLNDFVDALSNWYVRRSRDRFWRSEKDQDKWDAYNTLYEVQVTLSKLIAPFTPFFAETVYQNLVRIKSSDPPLSVHLCDYPVADESLIDEDLAQEMDLVRQIVSLGRAARTAAKLKVRQPLALVEIILARREHTAWLEAHSELIAEELNIKQVEFTTEADHYVTYQIKPDFKLIGPKFGKLAKQIAAALSKVDAAAGRQSLASAGELVLDVDGRQVRLTDHEVQVRLEARPGWSAAQGRAGVVVVKTELTPELTEEGLTREVIHHVQGLRKELNLAYEQRITLRVETTSDLQAVIERFADTIKRDCLAEKIDFSAAPPDEARAVKIEGHVTKLVVTPC